jgi:hypothetical protein
MAALTLAAGGWGVYADLVRNDPIAPTGYMAPLILFGLVLAWVGVRLIRDRGARIHKSPGRPDGPPPGREDDRRA